MVIKFLKLRTLNFKGAKGEREIVFNPQLTQIYGANRTGKTTIADAALWCLFGRNSEDKAEFGVKTRDTSGTVIPEISHEVELTIIADNKEITLLRCYIEKWSKPKGQEEKMLTGHTTNYYIDGDKKTEKDYKAYIESLIPEGLFRAITNPAYFPNLDASKQRDLLTKMVGEVSNELIAAGNPEFTEMLNELEGRSLEEFMQQISYKKKDLKDELLRIPVRIKEQKDEIVKITPEDSNWAKIEGDILAAESAIVRIDDEIADRSKTLDSDYESKAKKREEINSLRQKVQTIEFEAEQAGAAQSRTKSQAINKAENELQDVSEKLPNARNKRTSTQNSLNSLEKEKADFRARWQKANDEECVIDENDLSCPTCKRRLDEHDVQDKSSSMLKNFNTAKANRVEALEVEAAQLKKREAQLNTTATECDKEIAELETLLTTKKQAVDTAKEAVIKTTASILAENAVFAELKRQIESKNAELNALDTENAEKEQAQKGIESLKEDKKQQQAKCDDFKKQLYVRDTIANKNTRITELEKQEKTLNQQLSDLEKQEYTAQEFTKAHITELESKVNALFLNVRFTMFDHKINGSLKPICECTVDGVPYSDLNNADRINAGIDIINAICRFNEVYAPCFIDNAESINDVMRMDSQAIHLIVSRDKELVIINN